MRTLDGFDVWFEREPVAIELFLLEFGDNIRDTTAGCRPVAIHDDEAIDIAPTVGLTAGNTAEDDDTEKFVDIISIGNRILNTLHERSNRCVELGLWDREDGVVFLKSVRIDSDVVALRCFPDSYGADIVEEIDGPPYRRPGNAGCIDELRDREFRFVGVG